jgi:putative ABC transport system ATP-binding protein
MPPSPYILEASGLGRELSPGKLAPPAAAQPNPFLLHEVNFQISSGEVLAVVGPSGAGKSTLLRLLNRLDEPTHGTVLLDGEDYRTLHPRQLRRRVGMVMQRAYLFPGTVAENVAYGPAQQDRTLPSARIEEMLAQVGLAGYAERNALTLSGGEAQRVAITRALANAPEVLLLDEPTSALDEASRSGVESLVESLIRERHLTCIWVTHSPAQARTMADRVLALEAGQVRAIGTPAEVLG